MKKTYTVLLLLTSIITFAQQTISFETSEGYQLGTLHTQNGWEVTEGSDGVVLNQVVSNTQSSQGSYSFKNAHEPSFDFQFFPIFGASKTFDEPADYNNFTISYDVLVTDKLGSDFEFTLFAINGNDEFVPVAGVGIENRGFIYVIKDADYGINYTEYEWTQNEWINVKIEVAANEIKYYINNILENTIANYTQLDIVGMNMLHNNYGYDGYYDNFVINTGNLSTTPFDNVSVAVYPNPTSNTISLLLPDTTQLVHGDIYNVTGQKVLHITQAQNIDVSKLSGGTYILKAKTNDGSLFTKKIIKN